MAFDVRLVELDPFIDGDLSTHETAVRLEHDILNEHIQMNNYGLIEDTVTLLTEEHVSYLCAIEPSYIFPWGSKR